MAESGDVQPFSRGQKIKSQSQMATVSIFIIKTSRLLAWLKEQTGRKQSRDPLEPCMDTSAWLVATVPLPFCLLLTPRGILAPPTASRRHPPQIFLFPWLLQRQISRQNSIEPRQGLGKNQNQIDLDNQNPSTSQPFPTRT